MRIMRMDSLGRVTIPRYYQKIYGITENDALCFLPSKSGILITSPKLVEMGKAFSEIIDINSDMLEGYFSKSYDK